MPAEMTFTTLQGQMQAYLERGSTADTTVNVNIPLLINQAERRIARELKILGFVEPLQSQFNTGSGAWIVTKPDRWRQTVSWNFGNGTNNAGNTNALWTPIFPRSLEYVRSYNRDVTLPAPPQFYADYDYQHWAVAPTPDQAYPFEVLIYQLPALLDNSNQQNWLTAYAPNLLLFGALLQAEPFLKHDERVPTWKDFYTVELAALQAEDMQKMLDRTVTRQDD